MSNVRNTPQAIATANGTDNQGPQQDNVAVAFPNTVDALPGMQYPDMPGGPNVNAPLQPWQTAHPASTPAVNDPASGNYYASPALVGGTHSPVPDLLQYGTLHNVGGGYETRSEE